MSHHIRVMAAQQQWEIAKGHLKASVSICGSTFGSDDGGEKLDKYSAFVESFIEGVEGLELHIPPTTRDGR